MTRWAIYLTATGELVQTFVTAGAGDHPKDHGFAWDASIHSATAVADGIDPAEMRWDATTAMFVDDLAQLRARRWEAVKAAREQALLTATTPFGTFDTDEVSKANINGQVAALATLEALGSPLPATITWRMHDNSTASLTPTQFRQAALLVAKHVADVYAVSWTKQAAIDAATARADIEVVDPTNGWPS